MEQFLELDVDEAESAAAVLSAAAPAVATELALALNARGDAEAQRQALMLLSAQHELDGAGRRMVLDTLRHASDSRVVSQAAGLLMPDMYDPRERRAIADKLRGLARAGAASARGEALAQLVRYDEPESATRELVHLLEDSSPSVREAALQAIRESRLRSARLKDSLMALAIEAESPDLRRAAVAALRQQDLSVDEYAAFAQREDDE